MKVLIIGANEHALYIRRCMRIEALKEKSIEVESSVDVKFGGTNFDLAIFDDLAMIVTPKPVNVGKGPRNRWGKVK